MILAVLAVAAAMQPAASPTPNVNSIAAVVPMRCRVPGVRLIETPKKGAYARLADLPVADMHLLVDRRVGGCAVPVIVIKDVESSLTGRPASATPSGEPTRKR